MIPFAIAAVAGPAAAAAQSHTGPAQISPGYWEVTTEVTSPLPSTKTQQRCIKPEEIAKFMQGPSTRQYTCTYPTREIGGGKIKLQGTCMSRSGKPMPISGHGTFTSETLDLEAEAVANFAGLPVQVAAQMSAKRLSAACPAPVEPPVEAKPALAPEVAPAPTPDALPAPTDTLPPSDSTIPASPAAPEAQPDKAS